MIKTSVGIFCFPLSYIKWELSGVTYKEKVAFRQVLKHCTKSDFFVLNFLVILYKIKKRKKTAEVSSLSSYNGERESEKQKK